MLTGSFKAGQLLGALESKVRHAQCFDMALMEDRSVVLASKDYRLYIYQYVKVIADESIKKFTYRNFYDFVNLVTVLHISLPFVHRLPVWVQPRTSLFAE